MSGAPLPTAQPRLADHVKMRFDAVRDRWVVMAPERMLLPDEVAVDILKCCDGATPLSAIISRLAQDYDAPPDVVGPDVVALLQDLHERGFVAL